MKNIIGNPIMMENIINQQTLVNGIGELVEKKCRIAQFMAIVIENIMNHQ